MRRSTVESVSRAGRVANQALGGLALDLALYGGSALFAAATLHSTLASHRAWAAVALWGYLLGSVLTIALIAIRGAAARPRLIVMAVVWCTTVAIPLVMQAVQRAGGQTGRAQEEVQVIEDGGRRLLQTGTPYLDRMSIAGLADEQRLLGYLPYQPGMAGFGLPRAVDPAGHWWSDARIWFALVTVAALAVAAGVLRRAGADSNTPTSSGAANSLSDALVRGLQAATVLPLCALTLATGGDDLPVLSLCLLALALSATGRFGSSGLAVGVASALKLFAWPVAIALGAYVWAFRGRSAHLQATRPAVRYTIGAVGLPSLVLAPAILVDASAVVENLVRFPTGGGLVTSPAQSPLIGHAIATALPAGRLIALFLLCALGAWIGFGLIRWPPRTVAAVATISGLGLLGATVLLPSTRFGYLLYPVALLVWALPLGATRQPCPQNARSAAAPRR